MPPSRRRSSRPAAGATSVRYQVSDDPGGPTSAPTFAETSVTPLTLRAFAAASWPPSPVIMFSSWRTSPTLKPLFFKSFATSASGRSPEVVTTQSFFSFAIRPSVPHDCTRRDFAAGTQQLRCLNEAGADSRGRERQVFRGLHQLLTERDAAQAR